MGVIRRFLRAVKRSPKKIIRSPKTFSKFIDHNLHKGWVTKVKGVKRVVGGPLQFLLRLPRKKQYIRYHGRKCRVGNKKMSYGCGMKGESSKSYKGTHMFVVFKWHHNKEAVRYAKHHFVKFFDHYHKIMTAEDAIREAAHTVDEKIYEKGYRGGTSMLAAHVGEKFVVVGILGVGSLYTAKDKATWHKEQIDQHILTNRDESKRIAPEKIISVPNEKGQIVNKIDGLLTETRALGDSDFPMILNDPTIYKFPTSERKYLVMASEDLNLTAQDLANLKCKYTLKRMCRKLCKLLKNKHNDVSYICIALDQ